MVLSRAYGIWAGCRNRPLSTFQCDQNAPSTDATIMTSAGGVQSAPDSSAASPVVVCICRAGQAGSVSGCQWLEGGGRQQQLRAVIRLKCHTPARLSLHSGIRPPPRPIHRYYPFAQILFICSSCSSHLTEPGARFLNDGLEYLNPLIEPQPRFKPLRLLSYALIRTRLNLKHVHAPHIMYTVLVSCLAVAITIYHQPALIWQL